LELLKLIENAGNRDAEAMLWHGQQAQVHIETGDWLAAEEHLKLLAEKQPQDKDVQSMYGNVLCELGQHERGLKHLTQAIYVEPDNFRHWYLATSATLALGELKGCREACAEILKRFAETGDPIVAADAAKICLLGPNDFKAGSLPFQLAERAIRAEPTDWRSGWIRLSKSIAYYRAGQYDDAQILLEKLIEEPDQAELVTMSKLLLAMTQWQLGEQDTARQSLQAAIAYRRQHPIEGSLGLWLSRAHAD
jgi:predicted Zn-dependent protease